MVGVVAQEREWFGSSAATGRQWVCDGFCKCKAIELQVGSEGADHCQDPTNGRRPVNWWEQLWYDSLYEATVFVMGGLWGLGVICCVLLWQGRRSDR